MYWTRFEHLIKSLNKTQLFNKNHTVLPHHYNCRRPETDFGKLLKSPKIVNFDLQTSKIQKFKIEPKIIKIDLSEMSDLD